MNMRVTEFGRELRKHRIDREQSLRDMALHLKMSPAFLSAIETGQKPVPDGLVIRIAAYLRLSEEQVKQLEDAALKQRAEVRISLSKEGREEKELAVAFARAFPTLSEDKKKALRQILMKE